MSNIKVHGKPRLHVSINLLLGMGAILRDSTVAVVVVRTRPRAIPLPMITMRKSIHWFLRKSIHGFLFPYIDLVLDLSPQYGHMILVSRYLVLTGVNCS